MTTTISNFPSVTGDERFGRFYAPGGTQGLAYLNDSNNSYLDSDALADVAITQDAVEIGMVARYDAATGNRYGCWVGGGVHGDNLTIYKIAPDANGVLTYTRIAVAGTPNGYGVQRLFNLLTPSTPLASQFYRMEFQLTTFTQNNTTQTRLKCSLWPKYTDSTPPTIAPPPNGWTTQVTDSTPALQTPGRDGLYFRADASPNFGVYGNYLARGTGCPDPQLWSADSTWGRTDGTFPGADLTNDVDCAVVGNRAEPNCQTFANSQCTTPIALDRSVNLTNLTVQAGAKLLFEPASATDPNPPNITLDSRGSVVVYGTLEMKPVNPRQTFTLEITGADESCFRGGGMNPEEVPPILAPVRCFVFGSTDTTLTDNIPLADTDVGLWVAHAGKLDLEGTPRKGWLRASGDVPASATSMQVQLPAEGWNGQGWYQGDALVVAPSGLAGDDYYSNLQAFEPYTLEQATDQTGQNGVLTVSKADNRATCTGPTTATNWCWPGQTCEGANPDAGILGKCTCGTCFAGGTCTNGECTWDHPADALPACDPTFATCATAPEVFDLTRNVVIKGMPPLPLQALPTNVYPARNNSCSGAPCAANGHGRVHIHISNDVPTQHHIDYVAIKYTGPRHEYQVPNPDGTLSNEWRSELWLGRYGVHFHHCTDDMDSSGMMTDCTTTGNLGCPAGATCRYSMDEATGGSKFCYYDYCAPMVSCQTNADCNPDETCRFGHCYEQNPLTACPANGCKAGEECAGDGFCYGPENFRRMDSDVTGAVVSSSGSHAFVPHHSDHIDFTDDVAYGNIEDAYWWDGAPDTNKFTWEEEEIATNYARFTHCLASKEQLDPARGVELTGFQLGIGHRNEVTDSVAVGIAGGGSSSGFEWPSYANGINNIDDNVWVFQRNVSHNNDGHGAFLWENDSRHHVLDHFVAYRNVESGAQHGAYGNTYIVQNTILSENGLSSASVPVLGQMLLYAQSRDDGINQCTVDPPADPTCATVDPVPDGSDYMRWQNIYVSVNGRTLSAVEISPDAIGDPQITHANLLYRWNVSGTPPSKAVGVNTPIPTEGVDAGRPLARVVDFVDWTVNGHELSENDFRNDNFDAAIGDRHLYEGTMVNNYSRIRVQQSNKCWFTLKAGASGTQTFVVDAEVTAAYCRGPNAIIDPATGYCCDDPFYIPASAGEPEVYRQDYPCGKSGGPCCTDGFCLSGTCSEGMCP